MLGKDCRCCFADPSDEDWEEGDEGLDEDEDKDDDFEEEDIGATIDMANEAADEDSGPELSTDYLEHPAYTVDPPGLRRKAQAAEVSLSGQGVDACLVMCSSFICDMICMGVQ